MCIWFGNLPYAAEWSVYLVKKSADVAEWWAYLLWKSAAAAEWCVYLVWKSAAAAEWCAYLVWKSAAAAEWYAYIWFGNQLLQQNGRRRVVSVDTESNILDSTSLRLVINNHNTTTTNGIKPLELQPTWVLSSVSIVAYPLCTLSTVRSYKKEKRISTAPRKQCLFFYFYLSFSCCSIIQWSWSANSVEASPSEFLNKFTLIFCESASSRPHLLTCKTVLH